MPKISQRSVEDLKNRINIVDVVGQHVRLSRAGSAFKGLSPFTNEKTPSFFVYPDKGFYYCFSTSQGGDIIRFVETVEKLSFPEAVEALAERFNIQLDYEEGGPTRQDRSLRRELLDIQEIAAEAYHREFLADNPQAESVRRYWQTNRRFSMEVAEDFRIGFAPATGLGLSKLLLQKGFSHDSIRQSGLFYVREGDRNLQHLRERFRGRLMIPIREHTQGQVVAFTARQLDCTPEDDPTFKAKYVNSPETPLFHKGSLLFNFDRAREAVRNDPNGFIMVEGQLDAIRCWSSGFRTVVAPQGTGVGQEQLSLLKRHSDRLVVLLDADSAGQNAALRIVGLSMEAGMEAVFASIPEGKDPDELLATQGPDPLHRAIASALSPMRFAVRALLPEGDAASPRKRADVLSEISRIISRCDSEIARVEYLREAALFLGVDYEAAKRDFIRTVARTPDNRRPPENNSLEESKPKRLTTIEADLLCLILLHHELAERVAKVVDDKWLDHTQTEGRLLGRLIWDFREATCGSVEEFLENLEDPSERNCAYGLQARSASMAVEDHEREAEKLLHRLFARFRQRRIEEIDRSVANTGEPNEHLRTLLSQKSELLRTFRNPPRIAI